MKIHRLAKYFPILEGEEFDLLVEDIRKNGQLEPIVTVGGEILDGVNRHRACKQLGIEPITEEYTGDDPLGYVISLNIRRRHMDTSQRAMLATEMLPEFEKEAVKRKSEASKTRWSPDHVVGDTQNEKHLARDDAARQFGVSGPTIQRAKRIKEEAPEKVDDIIRGKTTVGAVDEELRQAKEKEANRKFNEANPKSTIKPHISDYLELCIDHYIQIMTVIKEVLANVDQLDPRRLNHMIALQKRLIDLYNAGGQKATCKQIT